jgi:hypothetical protein
MDTPVEVTQFGDSFRTWKTPRQMAEEAEAWRARIALAKEETGLECDYCLGLVVSGRTLAEAKAKHADCHGYTHCSCCGPCPYCQPGEDW